VSVIPSPAGWLVRSPTGAGRTASSFDELVELTAPHLTDRSWPALEAALAPFEAGRGVEEPDYAGYRPRPATHVPRATTVMSVPRTGSLHVRLAAFGLGVRAFDHRPVVLDAPHRAAPFRLLAADGRILGSITESGHRPAARPEIGGTSR
jgi:hypothetical protein